MEFPLLFFWFEYIWCFFQLFVCLVAADLYSVSFAFLWCFNDNLAYKKK